MEKRRVKRARNKGQLPADILFLCGFFLGTLIPNLMWKLEWQRKALASIYLLQSFSSKSVIGKTYFIQVLRMRGSYFLLCAICGISIFGVPLAVLSILLMGGWIGALFTISILQFGVAGGVISLSLLLPQYLLYLPVVISLMMMVYAQSLEVWRNRGLYPQKLRRYAAGITIASCLYMVGILLESWCNPWIVEKVLGILNIF